MGSQQFVSRAGEKLAFALEHFKLDATDLICADFGSSTGGFVDCLLKNGAAKVYAVETGYGVLDWKLRNDPRVIVKERTNAMHVTLPEKIDLITNDTSWTRQEIIFPNILKNLTPTGKILTLIKPHYEADSRAWKDKKLLHQGVLDENIAQKVTNDVIKRLEYLFPVTFLGVVRSPLLGSKGGNTEYLALFERV